MIEHVNFFFFYLIFANLLTALFNLLNAPSLIRSLLQ